MQAHTATLLNQWERRMMAQRGCQACEPPSNIEVDDTNSDLRLFNSPEKSRVCSIQSVMFLCDRLLAFTCFLISPGWEFTVWWIDFPGYVSVFWTFCPVSRKSLTLWNGYRRGDDLASDYINWTI